MRIISGRARGRRLFTPPGQSRDIRPTSDRAREALFSILAGNIKGARVLDLYAGTGALGVEALSRGARQVVFVDTDRQALALIQKNCQLCLQDDTADSATRAVIIRHDLKRGLSFQSHAPIEDSFFDIIFLDPPYKKGLAADSLTDLSRSELVTEETIVIAEEGSGETLARSFGPLTLYDQRRYGDTGFWFYRLRSA